MIEHSFFSDNFTKLSKEIKILERDYGPQKVSQHIAPHTLKIAAMWAILTRIMPDADNNITKVEKAKRRRVKLKQDILDLIDQTKKYFAESKNT